MRISDWSSTCALPICLGGCQCPELRIARIGDRRVILARRQNEGRVAKVEGAIEPQIERAGDAAFDLVGGLRLEGVDPRRSEEHTSELQSLMRISYAVFCLKKKNSKPHRE